ncbi:MAG: hypothetical protein ACRESK_05705 [Gammaproteobacteria bacterium]
MNTCELRSCAGGLPSDLAFLQTSNSELSGGMAKRLAIARAIAMDPHLYFLR